MQARRSPMIVTMKEELIFRVLQLRERLVGLIPGRSAKYAIGIFVDGDSLHVVCLKKSGLDVELVDADTLKLVSRLETVPAGGEETILELVDIPSGNTQSLDLTAEVPDSKIFLKDGPDPAKNASVLNYILDKYSHKRYEVAISLAEPQVHYSYFTKNWNTQEEDIKQKVIAELSRVRPNTASLKPEDLHVLKLVDGRTMAILRDSGFNLLHLLQTAHPRYLKRLAFVESAEISLINLVNLNYDLDSDEFTLIVYVGQENSRLIFLKGEHIFNISYMIGVGIDAENIAYTIYSRIMLEQDNLSLPKIHHIILAGECHQVDMKGFLSQRLPEGVVVEYLHFRELQQPELDSLLSRYAIATGAAFRGLYQQNQRLLDVDLRPLHIKEGRSFKLGVWGWACLIILAFMTFIFTIRLGMQSREITQLEVQTLAKKQELQQLEEMEMRLNVYRKQVSGFDEAVSMLDSLVVGSDAWSNFLYRLAGAAQQSKGVWITDLTQSSPGKVAVRGYSRERGSILDFSRQMGSATIRRVEVQEIHQSKAYYFDIELDIAPTTQ